MSKNIMSGIMKETGKKLERDIAKKLNSSCGKYYNGNKKLQDMISKENFADVIRNVNVSFRNENLNVSVSSKDKDAVSEQNRKKFDELCNAFFNQVVSEYFAQH